MSALSECHAPSGKIISAQHVRFAHRNPKHAHDSAAAPSGQTESKITLIKAGDTVTAIEVTCGCGAVIRLDCLY